jgi:hypothetical protein
VTGGRYRRPLSPGRRRGTLRAVFEVPGVGVVRVVQLFGECRQQWSARGAEFLTPPIDRGSEIRCYMRDPDGYLIKVGQLVGRPGG